MRRTTICRSSRLAVASLALGFVAAPVVAQDQAASRPESVVVQPGNTLWGLAETYLGDPFLWPAIYRLNTDVVEDPHWIFPGEVLVLVPGDAQPVGPAVAQLAPSDTAAIDVDVGDPQEPVEVPEGIEVVEIQDIPPVEGPTVFSQRRPRPLIQSDRGGRFGAASGRYEGLPYRAFRRGEFNSAGFLTEEESLPFGDVHGNVAQLAIDVIEPTSVAFEFQRIAVDPPEGGSYQVGDELWLLQESRQVRGFGNIMIPVGIATVELVDGEQAIALVDKTFGRIRDGLVALPLESFTSPGDTRPVAVEDGITGRVVALRDAHPLISPQDNLFIDLGRNAGVSLGDVFVVVRTIQAEDGANAEGAIAVFSIVHVRENTATGMVLNVLEPDVRSGELVRLIRKMPM